MHYQQTTASRAERLKALSIALESFKIGEQRGRCPQCAKPENQRDDALAVSLDASDGAVWFCHRCGWTGGIAGSEWLASHGHRQYRRRGPAPPHPAETTATKPGRFEELAPWGRRLWRQCRPIIPGTVAAIYLERRGCILPPEDGDLRWHPRQQHRTGYTGPALVALVTHATEVEPDDDLPGEGDRPRRLTLHRTWLAPDGTGKANLGGDKPRLLLPRHRSDGIVRLWPDATVSGGLALAEGIETALAAARLGWLPAWSTVSAGNLAGFPVLPGIEALVVAVDHDKPNPRGARPGPEAAAELARRYIAAGREVEIVWPVVEGQDIADVAAAELIEEPVA